ncbi:MAG: AzlD domain-containing protein [Chloroflexota bacterium]|nr:AzlD domain-containing protein [Chloroflexota bacterium]
MPTALELILIVGMAVVTFAVRFPVLVLVGRLPLPAPVFRALRYVPAAVLTAIIVPEVFMPGGTLTLSLESSTLVAGVVSALIAWRSGNLLLTITLGMGAFLLHRAVMGGF